MNTIKSNFKTMKINFLNLNTMEATKFFFSALVCLSILASCSDDDDTIPPPPNEEEVITDVTLTFTNDADANDTVELKSVDPDGEDGPLSPTVTVMGNFTAGATYSAVVEVYNSIEDEDITPEITDEEPDEHFFIYAINGLDMTFSRANNDIVRMDGNKLGYRTSWVANTTGTGSITIRLFHESETVDDSNEFGTQTGGSTDIDITFMNVNIQ